MTTADFTYQGSIFLAKWDEHHLEVQIDRIHEKSSTFEVSGEMEVRSTRDGAVGRLITPSRINLSSPQTRGRYAKLLAQRVPDPNIDWEGIVEKSCTSCMELFRAGEPVKEVNAIPKREMVKYRVKPLILEGQPNILFGLGGISKSYVAQLSCVLVDMYEPNSVFEAEPGRALYLDYETDEGDFKDRIDRIHKGLGIEMESTIRYRFCAQPIANDITAIQRIVLANKIDLVIIDSGAFACGGAPEDANEVVRYFSALRSLKCSTLTICHQAKNLNGEAEKTPFGSAFWVNAARNVWMMKKDQEPGQNEILVGLYNTKVNAAKLERPFGLSIRHDSDKTVFKTGNLMESPDLAKATSLSMQVTNILMAGAADVPTLSGRIGKDENTIRAILSRHKDWFFKLPDGRWALQARNGAQQ